MFEIAELVEQKKRMVVAALEVSVILRAFLLVVSYRTSSNLRKVANPLCVVTLLPRNPSYQSNVKTNPHIVVFGVTHWGALVMLIVGSPVFHGGS